MRRLLKCLLATLVLTTVFGAGFIYGVISRQGDPVIRLDLTNRATKAIRTATVAHEHGTALASNIAPGATASIHFFASGETSFRVTVVFADGHIIEGSENYAEAGYRIALVATDDGLKEITNLNGSY